MNDTNLLTYLVLPIRIVEFFSQFVVELNAKPLKLISRMNVSCCCSIMVPLISKFC